MGTIVEKLQSQINEYFVGKEEVVEKVMICLLAGGHVLLEDVPGVGKTTLVKTLAKSVSASFGRIQFTPDTLPGDVIGVSIYNAKTEEFEYKEGVIMNQILLADEINRTSPKTQSCLLEAMAEGSVTVDGRSYKLPDPFFVIATQNPVEHLGTYPLPEASYDRFMMRLNIGYPSREREILLAKNLLAGKAVETITPVCDIDEMIRIKGDVEKISVQETMLGYISDIISKTRTEESFVVGASPRAMLMMLRAAQARAYIQGRDFVKPDDVKAVAIPVLHHRLTLTTDARIKGASVDKILENLVISVRIPM